MTQKGKKQEKELTHDEKVAIVVKMMEETGFVNPSTKSELAKKEIHKN